MKKTVVLLTLMWEVLMVLLLYILPKTYKINYYPPLLFFVLTVPFIVLFPFIVMEVYYYWYYKF